MTKRGRPPEILGAQAARTQSARPHLHQGSSDSARERALSQWRVGGAMPASGLLVRPLLASLVAELREGPWSCVEVWLTGVGLIGDDRFGPEVRDMGMIQPIVYAKAGPGVALDALGQAVVNAAAAVFRRHPQASHWFASAERGPDDVVTRVHLFANTRRPALSLQLAAGRGLYAAAALPQDAIVCRLTDGDELWRVHQAQGEAAWDTMQAGLYAHLDAADGDALRRSWNQRTCGLVPCDPAADRAAWAKALTRRSDAWPAVFDAVFAAPAGHGDDMAQLAMLANAWLSAEAQQGALPNAIAAPVALLQARLKTALERTTLVGPFVVLHHLCSQTSLSALRLWAHAWALPQRLGRTAHDEAAASMESVYVTSDRYEQLRLRLREGCFITPAVSHADAGKELPACTLSPDETRDLSRPWRSPRDAARLSATVLGEATLMALWSGSQAPTQGRLHLAAKRLMTLATQAEGVSALQLCAAAGALDPALAQRRWPQRLQPSHAAWTSELVAPFVALWTAQLEAGINARLGEDVQRLRYVHFALHAIAACRQAQTLPMGTLFTRLQGCVRADGAAATRVVPLVQSLMQLAQTHGAMPQALRLLGEHEVHPKVRATLCAAFTADDPAFVRALGAHIEALCATGAPWPAALWLDAVDVSLLRVTDVVRLQLIVAGVKSRTHTATSPILRQFVTDVQDAEASLLCFVDDKQLWRLLCRSADMTAPLGTLLMRTSAPPPVLWEMWQGAADKTLSAEALRTLLRRAAAGHTLAHRLVRERCARTQDGAEVWALMSDYGLGLSLEDAEAPRQLAAIVEAGCRQLHHLGVSAWANEIDDWGEARLALRSLWARYAPGDGHQATLQTRLQLLDLRYAVGDLDAALIDAVSLVDSAVKHPKLLGVWSKQIHVGLETAVRRGVVPAQAVFDALGSLAHMPYPSGSAAAADVTEIGTQIVFSLVQWEQFELAAAVFDGLSHKLNGAALVAMIHACTVGRGEDKTTLPITLQSCRAWLVTLACMLERTKTPSMYLTLVDGHLRASLSLLGEGTLTVEPKLDDHGSVISDAFDEVEALDAHEALWLQVRDSLVDLHAHCPIGRGRLLQRQLTEAVGRLGAHDDVLTHVRALGPACSGADAAPLWRAFVLSTTDAALAQTRAACALAAVGIDIEAPLQPQIDAMPTLVQADAAVGMLVDLGGVLIGAQPTPQMRLKRFDAIAGVVLAGGFAVHRWWDLIGASAKSLTAPIAKRRLAVLAQLMVQGVGRAPHDPACVAYTAFNLVYYAEHALASDCTAQAQSAGHVVCAYAQKQNVYRKDVWTAVLRSLDQAIARKGLHLGPAFKVLEGLSEIAPELAAQGLSLQALGPAHLSLGVKEQLAHADAVQAEIGFHYYVVRYAQIAQLSDAARRQLQGALVEALRWSHVRTNAFDEMRHWDLKGVHRGLVTDIFAALQTATQWNLPDIEGVVAVLVAAAGQGAAPDVWAPIVTRLSASVARSPYMRRNQQFKHAQVVLRATPFLRPLADALDVMLA